MGFKYKLAQRVRNIYFLNKYFSFKWFLFVVYLTKYKIFQYDNKLNDLRLELVLYLLSLSFHFFFKHKQLLSQRYQIHLKNKINKEDWD